MAIVNWPLSEVPLWPLRFGTSSLSGVISNETLDAATEKMAFIVRAPKAGTISKIAFRSSGVTTPGNADVRLETVDLATGDPSGTLFAANTNGTQAISTADTWWTKTLTAGAVVTMGALLAVVIENATGNYNISLTAGAQGQVQGFPYSTHYTGAWSRKTGAPICALEYDDGSYAPLFGVLPISDITTNTINTGTTPDEVAVKLALPLAARAAGFYVYPDLDGDADVVLYDTDGTTPLTTVALDKDVRMTTAAGYLMGRFASQIPLTANGAYRLALKPSSATSLSVFSVNVAAAAVMGAMPGGTNWVYSSRTDAGAWTEVTTRVPPFGLVLDGIDAGTSGSHFIGG